MRRTENIMDMPISLEIVDVDAQESDIQDIFTFFHQIDEQFSPFKSTSEVSRLNDGTLGKKEMSQDMQDVLELCEKTKLETNGFFNIQHGDMYDPSGLVKGWAIQQAAELLHEKGFHHFFVDAGGDIQVSGKNAEGSSWRVGIRNPFNHQQNIKILELDGKGIATSGTYSRGQHIYNPFSPDKDLEKIVSISVIGPNVYEADRFATAAFAMQDNGIYFIESLPGFEAYAIDRNGIATATSAFHTYVVT